MHSGSSLGRGKAIRTPRPKRSARSVSYHGFIPASPAASRAKAANTREGGRAESLLRSMLWRRGFRFTKHVRKLPGQPDIVFSSRRVVVFCDGDFWHGRHWSRLKPILAKRRNAAYWVAKISSNRTRDRRQRAALRAQGWTVFQCWELDVLARPEKVASDIGLLLIG